MNLGTLETPPYASLRKGGKVLGRLALWVQLGFLIMGMGLFLDQVADLLSDAQFTWGDSPGDGSYRTGHPWRLRPGGWILGQLFRILAAGAHVLADGAEAAGGAGDLIEQHLVPTLGRIALALEERDGSAGLRPATATSAASVSAKAIRTEMAAAQAAGRAGRVIELSHSLTQHLRGEPLHALDREFTLDAQPGRASRPVRNRRCRGGRLGRQGLDASARCPRPSRSAWPCRPCTGAGLCEKCGRPVRGQEVLCSDCRPGGRFRTVPDFRAQSSSTGERHDLRVRCTSCRTAFSPPLISPVRPGMPEVRCPASASRARRAGWTRPNRKHRQLLASTPSASVFVASSESQARSSRRRWFVGLTGLAVVVLAGLEPVLWPRLKPRPIDPVERVAEEYLQSIIKGDETAQRRLSTIEEPPAVRSFQEIDRDRSRNRKVKGSFAPLARIHSRIESEFTYDPAIARFTPKNPLGRGR